MAKNFYYDVAKQSRINDGWVIRYHPYSSEIADDFLFVDLSAETLV
jgi:hypothetical protein